MEFPLTLKFKIVAIAPQIFITDANGNNVCYVKQKLFKLKEKIEVFSDPSKSRLVATIAANKVIDWSARYHFTGAQGDAIGSVGRRGAKSIWKAHYDVFRPEDDISDFSIQEENPWAKIGDSLFGQIPILGALTGYVFNPKYIATKADGTPVMRLTKQKAFLEAKFTIDQLAELTDKEQLDLVLSFVMLNLLERRRG